MIFSYSKTQKFILSLTLSWLRIAVIKAFVNFMLIAKHPRKNPRTANFLKLKNVKTLGYQNFASPLNTLTVESSVFASSPLVTEIAVSVSLFVCPFSVAFTILSSFFFLSFLN
jgi:hypothetical protein